MQHLVFEGVLKYITAITKEHESNKQTKTTTIGMGIVKVFPITNLIPNP